MCQQESRSLNCNLTAAGSEEPIESCKMSKLVAGRVVMPPALQEERQAEEKRKLIILASSFKKQIAFKLVATGKAS